MNCSVCSSQSATDWTGPEVHAMSTTSRLTSRYSRTSIYRIGHEQTIEFSALNGGKASDWLRAKSRLAEADEVDFDHTASLR